jgi:ankyrin repeat protein
VNTTSSEGNTPLIWGAHNNNTRVIELLLESGASLDIENNEGWTAIDMALIRMNY